MASHLGQPSPSAMLRQMTYPEWLGWLAFMELEPFDDWRADVRMAIIAQAIWNVQIAKGAKKGTRPKLRGVHEFMPRIGDMPEWKPPQRRQSEQEKFEAVKSHFTSLGMKPVKR